jgi:2-polyprenyl-3-methyl-5-hydroxy-6-metoxy-1,4-benzoquinol methylase
MKAEQSAYARYYANWYTPERAERLFEHYGRELGPHLPASREAHCLDVGCGSGMLLRYLRREGYHALQGIEVNPEQVAEAKDLQGLIVVVDDTSRWLREHPHAFDFITCIDVLEHIPREERIEFASALRGALRPGGQLVCTVPNANAGLAGRWRYNDYTHRVSFTEHSLAFLLRAAGFEELQVLPSEIYRLPDARGAWLKRPVASLLRRVVRANRRLEFVAEFGVEEGWSVPLTLNLKAIARLP